MPGAEGESRLDLDADLVDAQKMTVMRAMNHKTTGPDGGRPASEALPNPSPRRVKTGQGGRLGIGRLGDQARTASSSGASAK